jgi:MFS family permease
LRFALDASAAEMGYLGAALLFPNLLFSLHAGAWVDRHGRRRETMIFTALGRAAVLAAIPIAYAFGALTLTQLYLASFLIGTLSVLFYVSYTTLFVSLVPRERYLEASSLLNGSRAFAFVA